MNPRHATPRRGGLLVAAVAAALALAGGTTAVYAVWGNPPPPQPPTSASVPVATPAPAATPTPTATSHPTSAPAVGLTLAASPPVHITIPAIGVNAPITGLGLNPDGTIQVPPLDNDNLAGWYTDSPDPGALGPSVILGHVDTTTRSAVFYNLGNLRPGNQISVTRADHTVAVFTVQKVGEYPKADFPTYTVYGNTDHAALRLLTCGGVFNRTIGHYDNNIVVYATLTSSHPA